MLSGLSISNFAVAKNITLEFEKGLTVITGETGAGKSILVGALLVGMGGRWQPEFLRFGTDKSTIELIFNLTGKDFNLLVDPTVLEDGELIISRVVDGEGKSRVRIGGQQSTLSQLKDVVPRLVDVHSQFEAQSLLSPSIHLELLDRYSGEEHLALVAKFQESAKKLESLLDEQSKIRELETERARRIDFINFELEEFEKANPMEGEDIQLNAERLKLTNVQKLADLGEVIKGALEGDDENQGIKALSKIALKSTSDLTRIDQSIADVKTHLENIEASTTEASLLIAEYLGSLTFNPERLQDVEDRLAQLGKLVRRFGNSLTDVFAGIEKLKIELTQLSTSEERLQSLHTEIILEREKLGSLGFKIHENRIKYGEKLANEVLEHLQDLALEKAMFVVDQHLLEPSNEHFCIAGDEKIGFNRVGLEDVEFLISTNPGEPPKPITKVASGGELSRIMLALKVILSKVDSTPTLIFDEVDAGVGGRVGEMIGRKLSVIAKERQVFCITHLPQIASYGNVHLLIKKNVEGEETTIECSELAKRGRIDELARMLSGDVISQLSLKHAEDLLHQADRFKETI